MANKYWVGDGGDWDTSTTHWSDTDGGAGGAVVPGTSDDVIFNANSFSTAGQTVRLMANKTVKSISWAGVDNNPTFNVNAKTITLNSGAFILDANMTAYQNPTTLTMSGSGNLTSAGFTLAGVVISGTGTAVATVGALTCTTIGKSGSGSLTLGADVTCTAITHTGGTFDTAGYDISCTTFTSSGTTARTVTLGDTVITASGAFTLSGSNLTFNYNTSVIKTSGNFAGLSKTFNNVELLDDCTISGANVFNDVKFVAGKVYTFTTAVTQTISSISGSGTYNASIKFRSTSVGYTISTPSALTGDYFDIEYCTRSGAGSFTVTNSQDYGNNSGITFSTTFDFYKRYWVQNGGTFTDTGHWSGISNGSSGAAAPTTTEDVYFDANSFNLDSQTVLLAATVTCKSMNWTGVTNTPTFNVNSRAINITGGSYTLVVGMIYSITSGLLTISGTGNLNTAGQAIKGLTVTGTVTLVADMICTPIIHTNGTFDTAGYDISCTTFASTGTTARTLTLGDTIITMSGTSDFTFSGSSLTFNCNTSTIICGGDFNGLSKIFNNVELSGTCAITGSNTFNDIKFYDNKTYTFATTTNQTVTSISNTAAYNNGITWTSAGTFTITSASTLSISYYKISKCTFAGAGSLAVLGIDNGSNSNITFTNFPFTDRFWVGGTGTISDTTHLSGISGGVGGASALTSSNNIFFDANSFTGSGQVITIGAAVSCKGMDWTGATNTPNLYQNGNYILNIFGGLTLISDMTYTGTYAGEIEFEATSGSWTVITAGKTLYSLKLQGTASTATWTLQDSLTVTNTLTHTTGIFNTNDKVVSCAAFNCNGTGTRTLTLGASIITASGIITFTSTGLTLNEDTSKFKAGNNFVGAGLTFYDLEIVGTGTISGDNTFNDIKFNKLYTTTFTAGSNTTLTSMSGSGDASNYVKLKSTTESNYTITSASTITVYYYSFAYCTFAGAGSLTAETSIDWGNNINITFTGSGGSDYYSRYWVGGSGDWNNTAHWSYTSGGSGGAPVPTSDDGVQFDEFSFSTGSKTVTIATSGYCWAMRWIDTLSGASIVGIVNCYGWVKLKSDCVYTGLTLNLRNEGYIDPNGYSSYVGVCNIYSGRWVFNDDIDLRAFTFYTGTLRLDTYKLTCFTFTGTGSGPKTIDTGGTIKVGNFQLNGSGYTESDFLGIDIECNDAYTLDLHFYGNSYSYNSIKTFTKVVNIHGSNSFVNFNAYCIIDDGTTQHIDNFNNGSTFISIRSATVAGCSISSDTPTINAECLYLKWCSAIGTAIFNASYSIDYGGNTGWNFIESNMYWVGGSGNINDVNHWSKTSGGVLSAGFIPFSTVNAFVDANSFPSGGTLTYNVQVIFNNLDFTNSGNITLYFSTNSTMFITGLNIHPGVTITKFNHATISFAMATTIFNQTPSIGLTSNECAFGVLEDLIFSNGIFDMNDELNINCGILNNNATTFNTNDYNITTSEYITFYDSTDAIYVNLGSSIIITPGFAIGPTTTLNAGTSKVIMTGSPISLQFYGETFYDVEFQGASVTIIDDAIFHDLILTPDKTLLVTAGKTITLTGDLPSDGTDGHLITMKSTVDDSAWYIVKTSDSVDVSYHSIRDSHASGGATFNATDSVDVSGNTGWIFIVPPSGFNIYIGTKQITKIYIGSTEITKVYIGDKEV